MESHLLQMRGLKPETRSAAQGAFTLSHLLQMRGLKQAFESGKDLNTVSHLLQMRGLKQKKDLQNGILTVASFTDAWIETVSMIARTARACRIFYRCVD